MPIKKTLRAAEDALEFSDDHGDVKLAVQVAGTFVGTVTFEVSVDDTTWSACPMEPVAGGATITSATAPGLWLAHPGTVGNPSLKGLRFRARCSAFTSGAIDVHFQPVGA
jgi:hypothetical protein